MDEKLFPYFWYHIVNTWKIFLSCQVLCKVFIKESKYGIKYHTIYSDLIEWLRKNVLLNQEVFAYHLKNYRLLKMYALTILHTVLLYTCTRRLRRGYIFRSVGRWFVRLEGYIFFRNETLPFCLTQF